ncbi:PIN domain nuclease [Pseudonocardia broussonetiae]|uniref:Ribonuclease VapC n=1 Tax=Pseudonocardia broussonetiae TaxID=2736640 RepID=A0A6M6JI93_9PSEU|nr:PIN domain nuclease [Pseudonocardia broussonetiae]QJY46770.1 PIN domain nuclease [Pseudonocardia broussonetiae]
MNLVDSSAWIEFLRRTGSAANLEVRRLLREEPGSVAITEPVVVELLAGANSDRSLAQIEKLVDGVVLLPVDAALDYRDAAVVYRAVRARGGTVRKLVDCLIAVVAVRTGAALVHRDRDFDVLAAALPELTVRSFV